MPHGWTWSGAWVRLLVAALTVSLLAGPGVVAPVSAVEKDPHDGVRDIGVRDTEVAEAVDQRQVPFERPDRSDWPAEVSAWVDRNHIKQGTYRLDSEGRTWLLVAWGQRPTGGYQVRVTGAVRDDDGTITFTVELHAPGPDQAVIQVLTYPFDLITVDETDASFEFAFVGAPWDDDEQGAATDPSDDPSLLIPLSDVEGHWAEVAIRRAAVNGLVNGYPDGRFRPNAHMSRAEFVTLLVRALEVDATGEDPPFSDLAGHWAAAAVRAAVNGGAVEAPAEGERFRPDEPIDRLEIATLLVRALGGIDDPDADRERAAEFHDVDGLTDDELAFIGAAAAQGLLAGYPDGTFGPERGAARAEAVVVIERLLDRVR